MLPSGGLPPAGFSRALNSTCYTSGNLAVQVRVPIKYGVTQLNVTDSIYGYAALDECMLPVSSRCTKNGSERVCDAYFDAPSGVNDIEIAAYAPGKGSPIAKGAFPETIPASGHSGLRQVVVLDGSIAAVAIEPFLGKGLPIGQGENVWVVARDKQNDVIVGNYTPAISISADHLSASSSVLKNSSQAEQLILTWSNPLNLTSKSSGSVTADISSKITSTALVKPLSGIVYFTPGPNSTDAAPGPAATAPDGKSVYFAINDNTGCSTPGTCKTEIWRFSVATQTFTSVPLASVPGVSQLFVAHNGTVWIASFQPVGNWTAALPLFRMPAGSLSTPSPLPTADFGEGSGFAEHPAGTLWISSCEGSYCLQNHNGAPMLVETSTSGLPSAPTQTVELPLGCTAFGYLGFSVGDVAYSDGKLYVLGLNDGSAPPAHGTIWYYAPGSGATSCIQNLPEGFNPSAYFATITGSGSSNVLVFGAGSNALDFRWPPDHGFYTLVDGALSSPAPDLTPHVTANHVSQFGGVVYYVHHDNLADGLDVSGLGTYEPATGAWNVFPSASFTGQQPADGVVAVNDGAWFTAAGVCNAPLKPWRGVCFARARYLSSSDWGVAGAVQLTGLALPQISVGAGTGFGPVEPMNVHPGPFGAKSGDPKVCEIVPPPDKNKFTFAVEGVGAGVCSVIISDRGRSEPLVTTVTTPTPR